MAEPTVRKIPDIVEQVARFLAMKETLQGMERSFTEEERAGIMADVWLPWVRQSDLAREVIDAITQFKKHREEALAAQAAVQAPSNFADYRVVFGKTPETTITEPATAPIPEPLPEVVVALAKAISFHVPWCAGAHCLFTPMQTCHCRLVAAQVADALYRAGYLIMPLKNL